MPDEACTERVLSKGRACCKRCEATDTHPKGIERNPFRQRGAPAVSNADPREGKAQAIQGSMFNDPDSIEVAPVLPYAGTVGHAGSATSERRAARQPAGKNQKIVLQDLDSNGSFGMTVKEVREATGWHHGTASGCLSNLHKGGQIARLTEERGDCQVYVLPQHVNNRESVPVKPKKAGLAARVLGAEEVEVDYVEHVRFNGHEYYLAADLLAALTEGYES